MPQVRALNREEIPVTPPLLMLSKNRTTLGRSKSCDICISAENISRYHATIIRDQSGRYSLQEIGKNGALVNGRTGDIHFLDEGDEIVLCKARFVFERENRVPTRHNETPNPRPSLLKKRKRESDENQQPPSKKVKGNQGKETPRPKSPRSRLQFAAEIRSQDIEHLIACLRKSIQSDSPFENFDTIRFIIDLTEFLTSLQLEPIIQVTSNTTVKDAISRACKENRITGLLYFASLLIAKACELDKKKVIKKISMSIIEPFFKVHQCYIGIPSLLFAATKYQSTKTAFAEILNNTFLVGVAEHNTLVKSAQGDLVTNCLLDCAKHKSSVAPAVEYFIEESIFTRILHTALDSIPHGVGTAQMTVQLQMLDAVRFIIQIFEIQNKHACTSRIVHTIHDWVPDLKGMITQAQGTEGSLTACLKSLQIFNNLLLLYWKSYFKPVSYHNEKKFIREALLMVCHPRQHVLLPQCIGIIKNIFCNDGVEELVQGCLQEILLRKYEWAAYYKDESIQYFFIELYSIILATDRLSTNEKESLQFLDLENFDSELLVSDALTNAEENENYCVLL